MFDRVRELMMPSTDPRGDMKQNEARENEGKERRHVGEHSEEAISQELTALRQTTLMFRDKKWFKRAEYLHRVISENLKENPRLYQGMLRKLHDIRQGEL